MLRKSFIALSILLAGASIAPTLAGAQSFNGTYPTQSFNDTLPTQTTNNNSLFRLTNPLQITSFCQLIQKLLEVLTIFGIPIATLFVVYAGFKLVIARGNPEELKKARLNLFYTFIGIAIFLGAVLLGQVIAATIRSVGDVPGLNSC